MIKVLLISFIVFCSSIFLPLALAQESSPGAIAPAPSPVDYTLPYPGILPDHPLYFFKALRDNVLTLLIRDPVRKVEFYQLMTDKYMHMGVFLVEKGKKTAAIKTFNRVKQLLAETKELVYQLPPTNADEVGNIKIKYKKSLEKYAEIITQLEPQFTGADQEQLTQLRETVTATLTELEK